MRHDRLADEFSEDIRGLEDEEQDEDSIVDVVEQANIKPGTPVYYLRLSCSSETFYAIHEGDPLLPNSQVLVPTRYGRDLAVVVRRHEQRDSKRLRVTRIERSATEEDLERARNNIRQEEKAFIICREMIREHSLNMKLLSAHYLLEEPKILFFYTAEKRVDFRFLLKDLVAYFKTRIELRQVGFRDDTRIKGGIGICGREFCCRSLSNKLKSITIKMAKDQKISLNTIKISGPCEKLLCCLSYEHDFYQKQLKLMPPEGHKLTYMGDTWKITEVNIILGMVTLETEEGKKIYIPKTQFEKKDSRWWIKNQ